MKILSSYKKIAKEFIKEAAWDRKFGEPLPTLEDVMKEASQDDEDYVHIGYGKYKDKDHVDDPNAPTFKKDDSGAFVPAKGGDDEKGDDKGGEEKPKPSGKGLGKGDFERDFDDSEPEDKPFGGDTGTDADAQGEPPEGAREPDDSDEVATDIADELAYDFQDNYGDMSYDEYMETGFQDLPNNVMDKLDQLSDDEYDEVMDRVRDILDDKFGDSEGDDDDEETDESIIINGKKYRPIKESIHILKKKYQQIGGQ